MDEFVARLNIQHLCEALVVEMDEVKRKTLARLLTEEEAKLRTALEKENNSR